MKTSLKQLLCSVLAAVLVLALIPQAFASSYAYTVTDVTLTDLTGKEIDYTSGSCMVRTAVKKNSDVSDGYIVIMGYSADDTLISFNYLYTSTEVGESDVLGASISLGNDEALALVKVTVWDSLTSMTPLAEVAELVPGEEFVPPAGTITTKTVDGTMVSTVTSTKLSIKNSKTSSTTTAYTLTDDAALYVNGVHYCAVSGNESTVEKFLKESVGNTVLYQSTDNTSVKYNKIMMDIYALASVNQIAVSDNDVTLRLTSLIYPDSNPGNTIQVLSEDIENGYRTVTVTKNGEDSDIFALEKGDIIAVRYDIQNTFNNCETLEILATNETVTGQYITYDSDTDLYTIGSNQYEAARSLSIDRGNIYTFSLDPFGRLFSAVEEASLSTANYAIVERYVNVYDPYSANYVNSTLEYSFVDVVTLSGESKRLFIENSYLDTADSILGKDGGMLIETNAVLTAASISMEDRVIAYTVKASTGRINTLEKASVISFNDEEYLPTTNRLGKYLSASATVLDATDYDAARPYAEDYRLSSLSELCEGDPYSGFLVHKNSDSQYCYVVITAAGTIYNSSVDFVVAAANASTDSATIIANEEVYTLKIMGNGDSNATVLNISTDATITYYDEYVANYVTVNYSDEAPVIRKGAAFLYTVDKYGLVDQIDVIFNGNYTYADLLEGNYTIAVPDNTAGDMIVEENWLIDADECNADPNADELIQLFVAPVVYATDTGVTFAKVAGNYVDTNYDYSFALTGDTKIYSYDLSDRADTGVTAFNSGAFSGISLSDTDENGYAWFSTLGEFVDYNETDFDGMIQMAFVMAVDNVVTNAIVMNN